MNFNNFKKFFKQLNYIASQSNINGLDISSCDLNRINELFSSLFSCTKLEQDDTVRILGFMPFGTIENNRFLPFYKNDYVNTDMYYSYSCMNAIVNNLNEFNETVNTDIYSSWQNFYTSRSFGMKFKYPTFIDKYYASNKSPKSIMNFLEQQKTIKKICKNINMYQSIGVYSHKYKSENKKYIYADRTKTDCIEKNDTINFYGTFADIDNISLKEKNNIIKALTDLSISIYGKQIFAFQKTVNGLHIHMYLLRPVKVNYEMAKTMQRNFYTFLANVLKNIINIDNLDYSCCEDITRLYKLPGIHIDTKNEVIQNGIVYYPVVALLPENIPNIAYNFCDLKHVLEELVTMFNTKNNVNVNSNSRSKDTVSISNYISTNNNIINDNIAAFSEIIERFNINFNILNEKPIKTKTQLTCAEFINNYKYEINELTKKIFNIPDNKIKLNGTSVIKASYRKDNHPSLMIKIVNGLINISDLTYMCPDNNCNLIMILQAAGLSYTQAINKLARYFGVQIININNAEATDVNNNVSKYISKTVSNWQNFILDNKLKLSITDKYTLTIITDIIGHAYKYAYINKHRLSYVGNKTTAKQFLLISRKLLKNTAELNFDNIVTKIDTFNLSEPEKINIVNNIMKFMNMNDNHYYNNCLNTLEFLNIISRKVEYNINTYSRTQTKNYTYLYGIKINAYNNTNKALCKNNIHNLLEFANKEFKYNTKTILNIRLGRKKLNTLNTKKKKDITKMPLFVELVNQSSITNINSHELNKRINFYFWLKDYSKKYYIDKQYLNVI